MRVDQKVINDSLPKSYYPISAPGFKTEKEFKKSFEKYFTKEYAESVLEANITRYPFHEGYGEYISLNGRLYAHCCGECGTDQFTYWSLKDMLVEKVKEKTNTYHIILPIITIADTPDWDYNHVSEVSLFKDEIMVEKTERGLVLSRCSESLFSLY
jgi:hypothetical protein